MEKKEKVWALMAFVVLTALTCGCTKEISLESHDPGSPITFGVSTGWQNGQDTRTEYSGMDEQGRSIMSSSKYERIDWVIEKDRIRLLCDAAVNGPTSDYTLSGTLQTVGAKSLAKITPTTGNGLKWGTGDHYFYAWYPAVGMEAPYDFGENGNDKSVSSSNSKIESTTSSASGSKPTARVTGKIPDRQNVVKVGNEYKANLNYAYMYAAAKATPGETGSVALSFNPLVTTLEFTLLRVASDDINKNLTRVELSSTESTLTGTFFADLSFDSGGNPVAAIQTDGTLGNKITIDLPTETGSSIPGVKLTDTPLKITFLTLPVSQTNLSLTLYFGADYATKRKLVLKDNGQSVTVPACKKAYFRNLGVPNSASVYYDLDSVPDVAVTGESVLDDIDHSVIINTEKDNTDGYTGVDRNNNKTPWQAYYVDGSKSRPVKGTVVTGNTDYSDTPPSWLVTSSGSGSGLDDSFKFMMTGAVMSDAEMIPGVSAEAMISKLKNNNLGTVDLSKRDFLNKGTFSTAETANCYIVDGYGTFLIPLVYGNAYKNGANTGSYSRTEAAQSDTFLKNFVNADGAAINSPYILNDSNLSKTAPYDACVLWQDTQKSFEIVKDTDIEVLTSKPDGAAINCAYIRFKIQQDNIKPGNVVIVLRDATKKILWNWHIWIRADLTTSEATSVKNDYANTLHVNNIVYLKNPGSSPLETGTARILSEPLGWAPPISFKGGTADARSYWVAIVSTETQAVLGSFKVSSDSYTQSDIDYSSAGIYSATYYQRGRKDPFLPTSGIAENKISTSAKYDIVVSNTRVVNESYYGLSYISMLSKMIRNPQLFNTDYETPPPYRNLWDGDNTDIIEVLHDNKVVKTVYDPCPRGFTVTRSYAFTGVTIDGKSYFDELDKVNFKYLTSRNASNYNTEWPAGNMITNNHTHVESSYTIFIPALGWRNWADGIIRYEYEPGTFVTSGNEMYYWTSAMGGGLVNSAPTHFPTSYILPAATTFNASEIVGMPLGLYRMTNGFNILPSVEE